MHGKPEIASLTGLRFIAVLSIVLAHYAIPVGYRLAGTVWQTSIVGMPLFFALSGFIIHYVYATLFAGPWKAAVHEFAVARFSRLYPLYLFLFAYFFIFTPLGERLLEPAHWKVLLSYLTLTFSWYYTTLDSKALVQTSYGWSWSVATEWFFYIVYAVLIYRIAIIRSARLCLLVIFIFCILSFLLLYGVYSMQDSWEAYMLEHHHAYISRAQDFNNSFYRWLVYISPYLQILVFIGGCLTCQFYLLIKDQPQWRMRLNPALLASAGALWVVLCVCGMSGVLPPSIQPFFSGYIFFLHMNFLLAPACYMLILACALGQNGLSTALSWRVPRFIGEISYSLYLVHLIVPSFSPLTGGHTTLRLMGAMLIATAFAAGLYMTVEVPGKRWLRRVLQ